MKKLLLTAVALGALFGAGCSQSNQTPPTPDNTRTPVATETSPGLVGGDKDTHGCIGSAGYSWCAVKDKCIRVWEETCSMTVVDQIRDIVAKEHNVKVADVTVTIKSSTKTFARGAVAIAPGGADNEGAFLAYKEGNLWKLAFEGNGVPDCTKLAKLNFPKSLLTGICD